MNQKKELIYTFVIMLLVSGVVTISTIVFYTSEKAVLGISVASTLISIILAVLAIVYTYIDSSSQKENTRQMRESAQKLAESVEEAQATMNRFSTELENVSSLKDELIEKITDTQEWRETLLGELKKIAQPKNGEESVKLEEIEKVIQMNNLNNMSNSKKRGKMLSPLQRRIITLLSAGDHLSIEEINKIIKKTSPNIHELDILLALLYLEQEGRLRESEKGYSLAN